MEEVVLVLSHITRSFVLANLFLFLFCVLFFVCFVAFVFFVVFGVCWAVLGCSWGVWGGFHPAGYVRRAQLATAFHSASTVMTAELRGVRPLWLSLIHI